MGLLGTAARLCPFCGLSKQLQSCVSPSSSSINYVNPLVFKAGCIYSQGTYSYDVLALVGFYFIVIKRIVLFEFAND